MNRVILFLIFSMSQVLYAVVVGNPTVSDVNFRDDTTVTSIDFEIKTSTNGVIRVTLTPADVSLALDGGGDFVNKAAIRAAARTKYQNRLTALAAHEANMNTAINAYNTRRNKISLPIVPADFD